MKLGILGTSEIALRRFLPSIQSLPEISYAGVASRDVNRAAPFTEAFGGAAYDGYDAMLADPEIDAVYVPLPPSLHKEWAIRAFEAGKHVLLEKPAALNLAETEEIVAAARAADKALHVNYMYAFHAQLADIEKRLADGEVGEMRTIRIRFGFPHRGGNDFRYDPSLGGGALLDCGCYTVHLASHLLGASAAVQCATISRPDPQGVDLWGSATLSNDAGLAAQLAWGMDNDYRNELEVWGSTGSLLATRIFTAGTGFTPQAIVTGGGQTTEIDLPEDDQFRASAEYFVSLVRGTASRNEALDGIVRQAELIEQIAKAEK